MKAKPEAPGLVGWGRETPGPFVTVTRTMTDLRPALARSSRSHVQLYAVDDVSRSHPRHHHPGFELGLFDAVEHSVVVRGTSHATSRQTLVVLAPGEVHATRSRSHVPMRARLMVLEPELVARRLDANVATVTPRVHQAVLEDPELVARFVEVHAALERDGGTSLEGEEAELSLLIDLAVRHRVLGLEGLPRAGAETPVTFSTMDKHITDTISLNPRNRIVQCSVVSQSHPSKFELQEDASLRTSTTRWSAQVRAISQCKRR